ncbi:hypothetical protein HDU86_006876 [Geranomyces michiganensis]|nr:hypothetical protein HDU86_006876 [Geranomyces michiganensis]
MPANPDFTSGRPNPQPDKGDVPGAEAKVLGSDKGDQKKLATDAQMNRAEQGAPAPSILKGPQGQTTAGVPPPPQKGPIRPGGLASDANEAAKPSGKSHM